MSTDQANPLENLEKNSRSLFDLVERHGEHIITAITISREPINFNVQKVLNFISFGGLERAKKRFGYDDIFHLYAHINLEGGSCFTIEKNEVIRIHYNCDDRHKAQNKHVEMNYHPNVKDFISGGIEVDGVDNFFRYSVEKYNCQRFLIALLTGSNLLTEDVSRFILQDAKSIIQHLPPGFSWFARKITDLYAKIQKARGYGARRSGSTVQSILFDKSKWNVNEARKWLKENGYDRLDVDNKPDHLRFRQEEPNFNKYRTKRLGQSGIELVLGIG